MSVIGSSLPAAAAPAPDADTARLRSAVRQLQGVFVEQLLKAMRETVPDEGAVARGSGEDVFNSLLDQKLASLVPEAWQRNGLEAALFRQLHNAVTPPAEVQPSAGPSDSTRSR